MDLLRNYPDGYNVLPTANPHDVVNITLQMAASLKHPAPSLTWLSSLIVINAFNERMAATQTSAYTMAFDQNRRFGSAILKEN